jgi:hypothetical protein
VIISLNKEHKCQALQNKMLWKYSDLRNKKQTVQSRIIQNEELHCICTQSIFYRWRSKPRMTVLEITISNSVVPISWVTDDKGSETDWLGQE